MPDTVELQHGDIVYRVIPLGACLGLAQALRAARKRWHSHVLSPGCLHNPEPAQYGLVIEDDSGHVAWLAHSPDFPEVDKDLVRMLHGEDILDASKATRGGGSGGGEGAASSTLLPRLAALDARGPGWHHHMHFPDCVFNPHRGQWAITVEDGRGGVFSETYPAEPVDVLREVEVIYFRRFDAKPGGG